MVRGPLWTLFAGRAWLLLRGENMTTREEVMMAGAMLGLRDRDEAVDAMMLRTMVCHIHEAEAVCIASVAWERVARNANRPWVAT